MSHSAWWRWLNLVPEVQGALRAAVMAIGAFLLGLGVALIAGAQTAANFWAFSGPIFCGGPYNSSCAVNAASILLEVGMAALPLGAAILAYGVGMDRKPSSDDSAPFAR